MHLSAIAACCSLPIGDDTGMVKLNLATFSAVQCPAVLPSREVPSHMATDAQSSQCRAPPVVFAELSARRLLLVMLNLAPALPYIAPPVAAVFFVKVELPTKTPPPRLRREAMAPPLSKLLL